MMTFSHKAWLYLLVSWDTTMFPCFPSGGVHRTCPSPPKKCGLLTLGSRSADNLELREAQRGHKEDKKQPPMGPETTFLLLCSHAQHQCGGLCAPHCPWIGRMELFFQTPKCSSLLASCRQHPSGTDRTKYWCGLFIVKEISVTEYCFFCHFSILKLKTVFHH